MARKEVVPQLQMEVACDLKLRTWHLFSGHPGMLNDLNILGVSPHFAKVSADMYPPQIPRYCINGEVFDSIFYLKDGIYTKHKGFVINFSESNSAVEAAIWARHAAPRVLCFCLPLLFVQHTEQALIRCVVKTIQFAEGSSKTVV